MRFILTIALLLIPQMAFAQWGYNNNTYNSYTPPTPNQYFNSNLTGNGYISPPVQYNAIPLSSPPVQVNGYQNQYGSYTQPYTRGPADGFQFNNKN